MLQDVKLLLSKYLLEGFPRHPLEKNFGWGNSSELHPKNGVRPSLQERSLVKHLPLYSKISTLPLVWLNVRACVHAQEQQCQKTSLQELQEDNPKFTVAQNLSKA